MVQAPLEALMLWDAGWTFEENSHALLLDESTAQPRHAQRAPGITLLTKKLHNPLKFLLFIIFYSYLVAASNHFMSY